MDKYIKSIIEQLCDHYDYGITEISSDSGREEFWGAIRTQTVPKKLFVFFSTKDLNNIDNAINSTIKTENDYVNIVRILVVKNNIDISEILSRNSGNILIINSSSNEILYSSNEIASEILEIINILNFFKDNKSNYKKLLITYSIIAINVVIYIISAILSRNIFDIDVNVLDFLGAKDNLLINNGEYYRLFTCMFLHSGILHIVSNMYALYSIGGLAESVYGKKKYIIIYIISGIIASLFSYVFSSGVSVGASGAIFGVLGGVLVIGHKLKNRIGTGLLKNIIFVIVINLFISFTIPNIDISAHVGGLIAGIIISWFMFPKRSTSGV